MLAYKAWRETAGRWGVSAVALTAFIALFVVLQPGQQHPADSASYVAFISHVTYGSVLRELFVVSAMLLGLGGALQERSRGTSGFTLALPVSRAKLEATRALVGGCEVLALAAVPAIVLVLGSPLVHESYPMRVALRYAVAWSGVGGLVFAGAFLASTVFASEYTAAGVVLAILVGDLLLVRVWPAARPMALNVVGAMDEHGRLSAEQMAGLTAGACFMVAAGVRLVGRWDL